jgi:alpha-L-rhamnosidase
MGQNFSGLVRFRVEAAAGTRIGLRYGELLHADGTLNPMTSVCGQIKGKRKDGTPVGGPGAPEIAWQEDTYVAKGGGPETYVPRFTWHTFRYVEVTGCDGQPPLDAIEGLRIHSDIEPAGTFACSSERLNRIQAMVDWTFRSNLIGVQSDCPHRERFGYGGDLVVTCDAFMMNYDMASFYAKSARDGSDAAREDGMFTDTAPFVGIQYCGVGWAMAYPLLLAELHRYYGDRRLVEEEYAAAAKWLSLVRAQNPDHIVKKGLSDHEGLAPAPAPAMVTPLYYQSARILARLASILDRQDEARDYEALAREIKAAYLAQFLQKGKGIYGPGTQASQAFALYSGLVDAEERQATLDVLVSDIREKHGGHLSTGIFGTKYMLDVLSGNGRADVAFSLVDGPDYPGWGHMLEQGATTLWEHWKFSDNTFSHNHPMFGSVSEWLYQHVAGIAVAPEAMGADRLTIHPKRIGALDWAKATYRSIRGPVTSGWRREKDGLHLDVSVPVGATATVGIPATDPDGVTEDGRPAREAGGVALLRVEDGTAFFRIQSGTYRFASKAPGPSRPDNR